MKRQESTASHKEKEKEADHKKKKQKSEHKETKTKTTTEMQKEEVKISTEKSYEEQKQLTEKEGEILKKTMSLIEKESPSVIDQVANEDIIIFIGNTRAGKSTVVNYVIGNKLKVIENNETFKNVITTVENNKGPVIGIRSTSETTTPTRWNSNVIDNKAIWDAPGFDHNTGLHQDIANAFYIKELISNAKTVKFVLVSDITDITNDNPKLFIDFMNKIHTILPGVTEGVSIIFSKVKKNLNSDKICTILTNKIINQPEIEIKDKSLVEYFVSNKQHIGIFRKVTEIGDISKKDIDDGIINSINNTKSLDRIALNDITPAISPESEIFLYKTRDKLCEMKEFGLVLQQVEKFYKLKLDAIVNKVVYNEKMPQYKIQQIQNKSDDALSSINTEVEKLAKEQNLSDILKSLSEINQETKGVMSKNNILTKAKFIIFVDQILKIPQSSIFVTEFNKIIAVITKEIGCAETEIKQKLHKINEEQAKNEKEALETKLNETIDKNNETIDKLKSQIETATKKGLAAKILTRVGDALGGIIDDTVEAAVDLGKTGLNKIGIDVNSMEAPDLSNLTNAASNIVGTMRNLGNMSSLSNMFAKYVTDIKYDNPLLDHPELLQKFKNSYGSESILRLIDLSSKIDANSMKEICNSQNAFSSMELLMGVDNTCEEFYS